MSTLSIFLFVAGMVALVRGAVLFTALRTALAIRARAGRAAVIDESEVPTAARAVLEPIAPWIALGFEHAGWVRAGTILRAPPYEPKTYRVLRLRGTGIWAWLEAHADAPDLGSTIHAYLLTHDRDGALVDTDDAPGGVLWLAHPDAHRIGIVGGASPGELVDAHRASIAGLLEPEAGDDLDEHLERTAASDAALIDHARRRGDLRPSRDPGLLEPSVGAAWRLATRAIRGGPQAQAQRARRRQEAIARGETTLPIELELAAWAQQDALRAAPTRPELALAAVAITGVAFALSLLADFDPFDLVVLTAVVLFHELGHWLAMRIRGYHDARIFFVPFLGGATLGHKDRISLSDEMVVLLAGPVPGIALGCALLAVQLAVPDAPPQLLEIAIVLVAVNGLNLLPLFPLDGGRIVHRLIAQGRPWLEVSFRVIGIAGLAAGAIFLDAWILLGIAVPMLMGVRAQWTIARAERAMRSAGVPEDAPSRRRQVLERIREAMPAAPLAMRIFRARELLARLDAPPAGWLPRTIWLGAYASCFALPLAPLAVAVVARVSGSVDGEMSEHAISCADRASFPEMATAPGHLHVQLDVGRGEVGDAVDRVELVGRVAMVACMPLPWEEGEVDPAARALRDRALYTVRLLDVPDGELDRIAAEHEPDPHFHRALADAWIARVRAADAGAIPPGDAAIAAILGVPAQCEAERPWLTAGPVIAMYSSDLASDGPELLGWLCDQGMEGALVRVGQTGR